MLPDSIAALAAEIVAADLGTAAHLDAFRLAYLGRKGRLADLFDQLKTVPNEDKRSAGQQLNALKQHAQTRHDEAQATLEASTAQQPADAGYDYTLPPVPNALGTRHPLSLVREEMLRVFARIGFAVAEGPEIEDDWHNFTALNFPENHPARDMQDTFFVAPAATAEPGTPPHLLRTHTSTVQVRVMETEPLPIRRVMPGGCFATKPFRRGHT